MLFILSFRSQDIYIFVLTFWSCREVDQKGKINFKIYDVTTWLTNNHNTHIAQYPTKERQPDNEICSVNRI